MFNRLVASAFSLRRPGFWISTMFDGSSEKLEEDINSRNRLDSTKYVLLMFSGICVTVI